jgi:D-proline reductase (dithiol) PrdB
MNPRHEINRLLAKVVTRVPLVGRVWGKMAHIEQESNVPWTPIRKPLGECRVCLITTGGIHLRTDTPFNMEDPEGNPTYRVIPSDARAEDLTITHNYYDHRDADRDFNIILPLDRLRELRPKRALAGLTRSHYSFMGHIDGPHVRTLKDIVLPQLLPVLGAEKPDFVLLTPA